MKSPSEPQMGPPHRTGMRVAQRSARRSAVIIFALAGATLYAAAACGSQPDASDTPEATRAQTASTPIKPTPTPSPAAATATPQAESPSPTPVPQAVSSPTAGPDEAPGHDTEANNFLLFGGHFQSREDAIEALARARDNLDKSQVPVIIEMLRFFPDQNLWTESQLVLTEITGQDFGDEFGSWNAWMEWLAPNLGEYQPPERCLEWKINLLSLIHPRFANFLSGTGKTARIDLIELA